MLRRVVDGAFRDSSVAALIVQLSLNAMAAPFLFLFAVQGQRFGFGVPIRFFDGIWCAACVLFWVMLAKEITRRCK